MAEASDPTPVVALAGQPDSGAFTHPRCTVATITVTRCLSTPSYAQSTSPTVALAGKAVVAVSIETFLLHNFLDS